jgi:hypothetical protein
MTEIFHIKPSAPHVDALEQLQIGAIALTQFDDGRERSRRRESSRIVTSLCSNEASDYCIGEKS